MPVYPSYPIFMATEQNTPPVPSEPTKAFSQATTAKTKAAELSPSITKTLPKKTYEMPGPLGAAMRMQDSKIQFAKDYSASTVDRAKVFADKSKSPTVISKENVRDGTRGLLGAIYNQKSRGLER